MKKSIFLFFAAILCAMTANAETYRYSGEKDGWAGTEMTASTDGFYSYYGPVTGAHQFKIGTSSDQWAYNHSYVSKGFNNTDIQDIGDWGSDNCYTWTSATHYILVYYPNTTINTTNNVKICASTFLPDDSETDLPEPEPEPTELTYNVTVPAGTKACYICGNMTGWNFTEMTKVDDTHYTITIEGAKKSDGYKYASGGEWGYVEKDASGNEIGDRTYVDGNDVVARWASVYDPDAVEQELTYSVTVPEGTYACYIAMDTDPAQDGWEFNEMTKVDDTHYTFTRTGLKNKTYKYASGAGWEYVEKTAEDGEVADRTWAENDVVAKWASVYNPSAPTYDYYIAGTMNGWDKAHVEYGMTDENADGIYEKEITLAAGQDHQFKVTNGKWGNEDGGFDCATVEGSYEEVDSQDGNVLVKLDAETTFTVKFNKNTGKITFEGLTEAETETLVYDVEVPEGTEKCYIVGQMNNWEFEPMTQVDATHWTITYDNVLKTTEYKYACQASWDYVEKKADGNELDGNRTWTANDVVAKWAEPAKCYLMGNGDWVNGVEMEYDSENGQYILLCHHISAPFKFKLGDEWSDQVENDTENGVTWTDEDEDGNFDINLPEGDYNFYFKKDSKKAYIEVSTPAHTRTVPAGYYATVCLPNNIIKIVGATLFEVAGKDGDKVIFDEVITPVAGMPYIFLAEENTISFYCGIKTAATPGDHKSLHGTFEDITDDEAGAVGNILEGNYMVVNNVIKKCGARCKLPKNRAYFVATELEDLTPAPAPMPGRHRVAMGVTGENEATGVDNITENGVIAPKKLIENGQLIIIRDGVKYNVQGQKL